MKDEIKEILDLKIDCDYKRLSVDEIIILKDYITNLQQENERLKKALCKDNIVPKCKYDYLKRQKEGLELNLFCIKDYKSRVEKAIEYITTEQLYTNYQWGKSQYVKILKDLLNILKGVGKDER